MPRMKNENSILTPRECHHIGDIFDEKSRFLILGSFPIAKFTCDEKRNKIKTNEINFYYGGMGNCFWPLLSKIFQRNLSSLKEISSFLDDEGFAIADIVKSCCRKNGGSSDSDLKSIVWNELLLTKIQSQKIEIIFFTSKWVETNFKRHIHPGYTGKCVTLLSPSKSFFRSIGRDQNFKNWKINNPTLGAKEYREKCYQEVFQLVANKQTSLG